MNSVALSIAAATIFGLFSLFSSEEVTPNAADHQVAAIFDLPALFPELGN